MSKEDYVLRHGNERGYTVREVESNLKRIFIGRQASNGSRGVSWDDVIDMFIGFKTLNNEGVTGSLS